MLKDDLQSSDILLKKISVDINFVKPDVAVRTGSK